MTEPVELLPAPGLAADPGPEAGPDTPTRAGPQAPPEPGPDDALPEATEASALEAELPKVFGAVQRALQMASYLPVEEAGVTRVAVVSRQGQLIASAALQSPAQARFLLDQLQPLGFEERRSAAAVQKFGCDLLLVHEANLEYGQAQGIVRGLNAQRWPPEE